MNKLLFMGENEEALNLLKMSTNLNYVQKQSQRKIFKSLQNQNEI